MALVEIERGWGSTYDPATAVRGLFWEKGYAIPA
jgi:hypothetical protein